MMRVARTCQRGGLLVSSLQARLALHGRIRGRQIRPVEHRPSESLEPRILEVDHLLGGVVDDACRAHLPARRLARVVLAGLARRVDTAFEDRVAAFLALRAGSREAGSVRTLELK